MSPSSPQFSIDTSTPSSPASTRSGYPFPDTTHRTASNVYRARRGSNASVTSINSIGGSLDPQSATRRNSTVRETSQNAISTLLQPPIVRTGLLPHTQPPGGYKAPTTRDIPPVTLTNIPHVPPENFRDYLNRIGPLFESFQRGRAEPEQPLWLKKDKELEKTDRFAEALERRLSRDGSVSPSLRRTASAQTLSPLETPGPWPRRRSSAGFRRNRNEPTPLSTIPNVYFDEDFHLENPRTFDVVSERAEIVRPPPGTPFTEKTANGSAPLPRKTLATNAILQEKLSWYMDTVEVHLINSISTASSGFFAALGSLKDLQTEAEESVAKIQGLREDLRRLDQEVAVGGLEVAAKRRRRVNVAKLARATKQVEDVVENVKKADELVDAGNYDEAADQMDRVGRLVCGQSEPGAEEQNDLIDLQPLKALQGLDAGLQELQYRIGAGFAQRFVSILVDDLRQHVETVPQEESLKRWSRQRGIPPRYMESDDEFRESLKSALEGLSRAGHTGPATAAYREAVNREMKALLKKHLPSSSDEDAMSTLSTSTRGGGRMSQQEKSSILARNLRAMDPADAEKMLINVYTAIGEALRRVSTQTKVLLDVTSSMSAASNVTSPPKSPGLGPNSPTLPSMGDRLANGGLGGPPKVVVKSNVQEELSQALDMSSLLGQAVDTAQTQINKVLKVRNEQVLRLSKERFMRYFALNRLFADECEAVSGRSGQALKGMINAQISGFVQVLAENETQKIANLLDSDDWNAKDFTDRDTEVLQRILGSMSSDPSEWSTGMRPIWEDVGHEPEMAVDAKANGTAEQTQTNGISTPPTNGASTPAAVVSGTKVASKPAYIDDQKFILVGSAIALLSSMDIMLSLTTTLPSMTPTISTALLDVLRTFNSRSTQLILGAGATKTAGLKNITTKHLALASQALSFVIALVPYMRECVRRHLPSSQSASTQSVLAEFDKTKRLYQDHQSGIHEKLVEIMTSRSAIHVKTMLALPWDSAGDDGKVGQYMETLTKETLTLHRVLSRHLAEFDVGLIMKRIFESYKEQWRAAFGAVQVSGEAAERRLTRDAEAFGGRLGKVDEFGETGEEIVGVVRTKVDGEGEGSGRGKVEGEAKAEKNG
ncbi:Vacuolar protein sorting-associated protein 54, chloroplastic [Teratosphaeria destructans]|uniref:Vacuolar protein sorting-associated protein 54 n=1 Tax=Teratosphaeria destructans TaxID=418781 RepID=A0A9W7SV68_9PEZI|nr:Vacuolar protein sorting-associated protein 54, chloroplastic [Teratosphaeria destructans]